MYLDRKQRLNIGLNYFINPMLKIFFSLLAHHTVRNRCYKALSQIMKHTKQNTCTTSTIIKHIVLYGVKTLTMAGQMESPFTKLERKILRKTDGPRNV
jgi:hypothetical protein